VFIAPGDHVSYLTDRLFTPQIIYLDKSEGWSTSYRLLSQHGALNEAQFCISWQRASSVTFLKMSYLLGFRELERYCYEKFGMNCSASGSVRTNFQGLKRSGGGVENNWQGFYSRT
jgi:hypothetical protein